MGQRTVRVNWPFDLDAIETYSHFLLECRPSVFFMALKFTAYVYVSALLLEKCSPDCLYYLTPGRTFVARPFDLAIQPNLVKFCMLLCTYAKISGACINSITAWGVSCYATVIPLCFVTIVWGTGRSSGLWNVPFILSGCVPEQSKGRPSEGPLRTRSVSGMGVGRS